MLGKLIKYEFNATSRMFVLMYAALLVLAGVNSVLIAIGSSINSGSTSITSAPDLISIIYNTISGLMATVYVIALAGVAVLTMVIIVVRFYRMFGDEGYLWFTLPVTPNQHVLGKLIVSVVWSIASTLVIMVSLGLLFVGLGWLGELWRIPKAISDLIAFGYNPLLWFILLLVLMLTSVVASVLMFYTAISIGPNLTKSRLGGSVLAFVIIYFASQIIATIQLVSLIIPLSYIDEVALPYSIGIGTPIELLAPSTLDQTILWIFGTYIVGYIVVSLVYYLITRYFMTKKLNLA